jgi:hypothetical protein
MVVVPLFIVSILPILLRVLRRILPTLLGVLRRLLPILLSGLGGLLARLLVAAHALLALSLIRGAGSSLLLRRASLLSRLPLTRLPTSRLA